MENVPKQVVGPESPLKQLDERCPVPDLLTPKNAEQAKTLTVMGWVSIYRNSPTNHTESEILMGRMTIHAVEAGRWVDVPLQGHYQQVVEAGLATVETDGEGNKILRPTEKFTDFVKTRLAPYGPKKGQTV